MVELVDENEGYGSEDEDENTNGLNGEKIVNFLGDEEVQPLSFSLVSGPSKSGLSSKTQSKPDKQQKKPDKPTKND